MPSDVLVEARNVTKRFPGVTALKNVDFVLRAGEIHALVGENGAGKSTLVKILSGVFPPDEGTVEICGHRVARYEPAYSMSLGVGTVYQGLSLVNDLSILQNLFLGHEHVHFGPIGWLNLERMRDETTEALAKVGLSLSPFTLVANLSASQQQLVEIARTILHGGRVIILDEPTDKLTATETQRLFELLQALKAQGRGMIYITHKLDELREIADRVTVFRDGQCMGTVDVSDGFNPALIIRMMVGRDLGTMYPKRKRAFGPVILSARGISALGFLKDINLDIRQGEVVGLAGLVGSGRSLLAKVLVGAIPPTSGTVYVEGQPVRRSQEGATPRSMAIVPEDRHREGLFIHMNVRDNMTLPAVRRQWLDFSLLRRWAEQWVDTLKIRTTSIFSPVSQLSGGNQQKVMIARGLLSKSRVFILDEPTQGVDVGAKTEIYSLINELVVGGAGILLISSELRELMGMSDRIIVMRDGALVREFQGPDFSQEALLAAIFGEARECA